MQIIEFPLQAQAGNAPAERQFQAARDADESNVTSLDRAVFNLARWLQAGDENVSPFGGEAA